MVSRTPSPPSICLAVVVSVALLFFPVVQSGISSNNCCALSHHSQTTQLPHIYTIEVVSEYPHDPGAFTEGLVYGGNNTLYESTGGFGESSVRKVTLQTGKVEALQEMPSYYFGEGLTLLDERLYQLTWLQKIGFVYDRKSLSKVLTFTHQMDDGWGLTTDGQMLFGSDGSSTLYQIDPVTMKVIQKQNVRYKDLEVPYLNELEFVNGEVWANIIPTDCIVRISPRDGTVLGWVLLPTLREKLIAAGEIGNHDVLNGIAWDSDEQRLFVTGKFWPKLFEIELHPMKVQADVNIEKLCIVKTRSSSRHAEA